MIRSAFFALSLLAAAPVAAQSAASGSPEQIVAHHISAFASGDLDGVVSDYADDATVILPDTVLKGKEQIRDYFQKMLANKPSAPLAPQRKVFEGEVAYLTWTQNAGKPDEVYGSDTFLFHDGKIMAQTVAIVAAAALHK